jgi:hypothetical protein
MAEGDLTKLEGRLHTAATSPRRRSRPAHYGRTEWPWILYGHAAAGGRALFVTVLGENHGRMLAHLRPMRFFDPSVIPDKVTYISAYHALEDEGLKGLSTLLRREVQAHGATLLVLDGMSAIEEKAGAGFEMKRLTHELQTLASVTNCTMFLLTTASGVMSSPQHTMVDGLIELRQRLYGLRNERRLKCIRSGAARSWKASTRSASPATASSCSRGSKPCSRCPRAPARRRPRACRPASPRSTPCSGAASPPPP